MDARDTNGRPPLNWAAMAGRTEVIGQLLEAGANIEAANKGGWTALHYATSGKHQQAAELLLAQGANPQVRNAEDQILVDLLDDITRDNANLKQLLGEIRSHLPKGWQANISPAIPVELVPKWHHSEAPSLAIWRSDEVLGRWHFPNPDAEEEHPFESCWLCFHLQLVEHVPSELYPIVARENAQKVNRRSEHAQQLKRGIKWGWMGNNPIPPQAFDPETADQQDEVRRYALLWMRTEPKALPTHYYRTLSFNFNFQETLELKDPAIETERKAIHEAVLRLTTAYRGQK